jgi:hypothetical protein
MQTIFKTIPATNFTIIANDLVNSDIPPIPFKVLCHLLSQPDKRTYTPQYLNSIIKPLGLTNYASKKSIKYLQNNGYLLYLKGVHTAWQVSDKVGV